MNIYFSADKSDLQSIGKFKVGESWARIKNLNLCKPSEEDDPNIIVIDLIENEDIIDTEFVSINTAKFLIGEFWKVPAAIKKIEEMISRTTVTH